MHPFYEHIERAGINQAEVARRMGVSRTLVTLVKQGKRQPGPQFREAAAAYLREAGILHPERRAYHPDELFVVPLVTSVSISDRTVSEVA